MDKMLEEVKKCINASDKIVVGVSGGADSMVLLNLILQANKTLPFTLQVLHIEHGIREAESVADAKFVENYCKQNSIACEVINVNVPKLAKQNKQTLEQCARNVRYQQFEKYINNGYKVFLAHNKNDQAETVLMHIFRGSGLDGAKGIVSRDNIFRPLLQFTKQQILEYAAKKRIKYVEDSTNACCDYTRNFLRNHILPQIEQKYPSVVENISKFAEVCAQTENFINQQICPDWIYKKNDTVYIDNVVFAQHKVVIAKVIKMAYNMCGQWADLESKHIVSICDFVQNCKNGAILNLPHNIMAELRQNSVLFYTQKKKENITYTFMLGKNQLPNGKIIEANIINEDIVFGGGNYYADYHKIPQNAVWRTRKQGDVFQKLGSHGKKSLNDYFTDKKLSLPERDNAVLLVSDNNVLIVLGYDISDNIKIDSDTLDIIKFDCTSQV